MKKLFFALVISLPVFAGEVVLMDIPARDLRGGDEFQSRFIVNEAAGTVDAKLTVSETIMTCIGGPVGYPGRYPYPGPGPRPYPGDWHRDCMTTVREIFTETQEIEGMTVADSIVSYNGTVCGKMGLSRVLKVPTFYLNGNCKLVNKMTRVRGERRLQVKLVTK